MIIAAVSPSPPAIAADPWPGDGGTRIWNGGEPSGIVWHERLEKLFWVHDNGYLYQMDTDGAIENSWTLGGDLEGVAIADSSSVYIYLGVEHPDSIEEFDISTGSLTGKSWDLTSWMTGSDNMGLEALTFVPNGAHPYADSSSGGLFYAGLQADGKIYVFDVDLSASGVVSHVDTITPVLFRIDLSGLHYSIETGTLYAIFDSYNFIREMQPDGTFIAEYELPGSNQEGVTLVPSCPVETTDIYIAEDSGAIWRYGSYPVACTDSDSDGITDAMETTIYGTNPNNADSDLDDYSDYIEIRSGSDANSSSHKPEVVRINFQPLTSALLSDYCRDSGSSYSPIGYGW